MSKAIVKNSEAWRAFGLLQHKSNPITEVTHSRETCEVNNDLTFQDPHGRILNAASTFVNQATGQEEVLFHLYVNLYKLSYINLQKPCRNG
jgi:hypothetical protein